MKLLRWRTSLGRRLTRDCRAIGARIERVVVQNCERLGSVHYFRISRNGKRMIVACNAEFLNQASAPITPRLRLPTYLDLFSRTDGKLQNIVVDVSDGNHNTSGVVAFCSCEPDAILVPDEEFCRSHGYAALRDAEFDPAANWWMRGDSVLWRGSTSGMEGVVSTATMDPAELMARVGMCLMLRNADGVDAKFSNLVTGKETATDLERLTAAGIMAERLDRTVWKGYRYALDIDGNTNAWSNLFTRLLLGNCVIKIASAGGYRQWYYDRLEPWVNFVPVRADMSDLIEKIEWCRSHAEECWRIACAGRELALSMTFETETRDAVERLNAVARGLG